MSYYYFTPDKARLLVELIRAQATQTEKAYEQLDSYVDKPLKICVDIAQPSHSSEQQSYYWTVLNQWGREQGYTGRETEEIVHNAVLCEAFGVKKRLQYRGHIRELPNRRSSRLSISDYSYLILVLEAMMSDQPIPEREQQEQTA